jgi:hypothetical protein
MKTFEIEIVMEATRHDRFRIEAPSKKVAMEIAELILEDSDEAHELAKEHDATIKSVCEGEFDVDESRIIGFKESKWKIQTCSANGWADLKVSADGGPYEVELMSCGEAHAKLREEFNYSDYRVTQENTGSDDDIY